MGMDAWNARDFFHRLLDASLGAGLLLGVLQLVPIPAVWRTALSPGAPLVDRALLLSPSAGAQRDAFQPLSIDVESGVWAIALGMTLVLVFWCARSAFEQTGGLRLVARGIAWIGLALGVLVFIQRAGPPDLIYGFWRPVARIDIPHPIGPFLNRNDLAAWLIVALPVVLGYALARVVSDWARPKPDVTSLVNPRAVSLAASLCLMFAALLASLSRSGLLGAVVGLGTLLMLSRRRLSKANLAWLTAGIALIALAATAYANLPALAGRVGELTSSLSGGRMTIWRETWPMARDFPLLGIGLGGFERGMSVYQQSTRQLFFNHAHNEYLQLLVEGGGVLAVATLVGLFAGGREMASRLRNDRSPMFFVRAGAAGAVTALLVQSVWHIGIRMPATGVLFAIAAAMASYRPAPDIGEQSTARQSERPSSQIDV